MLTFILHLQKPSGCMIRSDFFPCYASQENCTDYERKSLLAEPLRRTPVLKENLSSSAPNVLDVDILTNTS